MGNTSSSRKSKKENKENKKVDSLQKTRVTQNEINVLEHQFVNSIQSIDPESIDSESMNKIKKIFKYTDIAKNQLDRNGKTFTKDDYIAILVFIQRMNLSNIDSYEKMTIQELIIEIRNIIYNPVRFESNVSNTPSIQSSESYTMSPSNQSFHPNQSVSSNQLMPYKRIENNSLNRPKNETKTIGYEYDHSVNTNDCYVIDIYHN